MILKNRLKGMVQLALVDNTFDDIEKNYIMNLGKAHKIKETEIEDIILQELKKKEFEEVKFVGLSMDEKIEYLVNIVELMKVDGKVYLSEIKFCKDLAQKLGFKRSVIDKVSAKVHSNPGINTNFDLIRKEIEASVA